MQEQTTSRPRNPSPTYKAAAVVRAIKALASFSPDRPSWTLTELVEATGTPRDTLLGIVNTLVAHGMLHRGQNGSYRLGFMWLGLGALYRNQFDVRAHAVPLMQSIRDAINETVILSMRVGDQAIHLDYVESTQPIRRRAQIGASVPLYAGATGIALLSALRAEELQSYFERLKLANPTIMIKKIEQALASVERDGAAVAASVLHQDMTAVAAAVSLYSGELISLTISCPSERFTPELRESCIEQIKSATSEISKRLGFKR